MKVFKWSSAVYQPLYKREEGSGNIAIHVLLLVQMECCECNFTTLWTELKWLIAHAPMIIALAGVIQIPSCEQVLHIAKISVMH